MIIKWYRYCSLFCRIEQIARLEPDQAQYVLSKIFAGAAGKGTGKNYVGYGGHYGRQNKKVPVALYLDGWIDYFVYPARIR